MDLPNLIKDINTLHSLVKATRTRTILKLTRDNEFWASKAASNNSNLRAKRKTETSKAIFDYLRRVPLSDLIEEVLRYEPSKYEGSIQVAPVPHRTVARILGDEKLKRHLQSLEDKFGPECTIKILEALKMKGEIDSAVGWMRRKEREAKKLEKIQKKRQKKKQQAKQKSSEMQQVDNAETDSALETDDEETQAAMVCDSHGSDDESEDVNMEQDETGESDETGVSDETGESDEIGESDETDESDETGESNETGESDEGEDSDQQSTGGEDETLEGIKPSRKNEASVWKMKFPKTRNQREQRSGVFKKPQAFDKTSNRTKQGKVSKNHSSKKTSNAFKQQLLQSWAAKQAQKGIKPFARKKIVFDTKGEGKRSPFSAKKTKYNGTTRDLRPSGVAKRAQNAIKPYAGKKQILRNGNKNGLGRKDHLKKSIARANPPRALRTSGNAKRAQITNHSLAGKKVSSIKRDATRKLKTTEFRARAGQNVKKFVPARNMTSAKKPQPRTQSGHLKKPIARANAPRALRASGTAKRSQKVIHSLAGRKASSIKRDTTRNQQNTVFRARTGQNVKKFVSAKNITGAKKPLPRKQSGHLNNPIARANPPRAALRSSGIASGRNQKTTEFRARNGQNVKKFVSAKYMTGAKNPQPGKQSGHLKKPIARANPPRNLRPSGNAKRAQITNHSGKKGSFIKRGDATRNQKTSEFRARTGQNVKKFVPAKNMTGAKKPQPRKVAGAKKPQPTKNSGAQKPQQRKKANVHPSWAAKQAMRGIKPFAGTKISFDD